MSVSNDGNYKPRLVDKTNIEALCTHMLHTHTYCTHALLNYGQSDKQNITNTYVNEGFQFLIFNNKLFSLCYYFLLGVE